MNAYVVGAGAWGKNLVRTLHSLDALAGVVEVSEKLRDSLAEQYPKAALYDSIDPILNSDVRAVMVAVPAPLHYEVGKKLLEAGKDVFIEKPMALSVKDSEELVSLAAARDCVLMVGHLLIYQSAVRWIKESVDAGKIGELRSIHQIRCGLGRARSVENVLWSLGVHDVAVAQYLVGCSPMSLDVVGQRVLQDNIEDDVYLHLSFPGNVQTHLHCSWLWPVRERGMTVVGTAGMYVYNELQQTVELHNKSINSDLKNVDNGSELVFEGTGEPLKVEVEHFLECVENRNAPISDGASALEVVRILEQATRRLK